MALRPQRSDYHSVSTTKDPKSECPVRHRPYKDYSRLGEGNFAVVWYVCGCLFLGDDKQVRDSGVLLTGGLASEWPSNT